jgi:hypothetical protein
LFIFCQATHTSWNEIQMTQKSALSLAWLLVLASCEKKQDQPALDPTQELSPRTTRTDRPSRDAPSTRDKLRTAFEAAKAIEPGAERNQALAELVSNALESAPDIAAEVIRELPAGIEEKQVCIEAYLAALMAAEKTEEALAWADSLGDEGDVAFARGKVLLLLAEKNPQQAAALLPPSGFTAAGVDPAAEQVLQTWVAQQPADAAAWATRLPAGDARTAGFKVIFTQWIGSDSAAALSWAASQTNPQLRQETLHAMTEAFLQQPDPIRTVLLEPAEPNLRAEIENGIAEIVRQAQEAEPPPEPDSPPETGQAPEPAPEP